MRSSFLLKTYFVCNVSLFLGCTEPPDETIKTFGPICGAKQAKGLDGACLTSGIPMCDPMFIDEYGLCRPSTMACPPGTIANAVDGCVAVGITNCAPDFLADDGICHVTMANCPNGTFALPENGCVPIDFNGCGTGRFGNVPDDSTNIYVDPSVVDSGDGSKNNPVKTITEALSLAQDYKRVVLAGGEYDEPVNITRPVTLAGRCPSMVTIRGTMDSAFDLPVIIGMELLAKVVLENITVSGPGIGILVRDSEVEIRGVHIFQTTPVGILVHGELSRLHLEHSLIQGVNADVNNGKGGIGLVVQLSAQAKVLDTAFIDNHTNGVDIVNPLTSAEIRNSLIANTKIQPSTQDLGVGVKVWEGAELALDACAIVGNQESGIDVGPNSGSVRADRIIVEDTKPSLMKPTTGAGITATQSAFVSLTNSVLTNNVDQMVAAGTNTTLNVEKTWIRNGRARGVQATNWAHVTLEDSSVLGNRGAGVVAINATVDLNSSIVEETVENDTSGLQGQGVVFQDGAAGTMQSCAILGNKTSGILLEDPGTNVTISDSLIATTQAEAMSSAFGRGISVQKGAQGTFVRNAVIGNAEIGLFVSDSAVFGTSLLIQDTHPSPMGTFGLGCFFHAGSDIITLEKSVIANHRVAGVGLLYSNAMLNDIFVDGTDPGQFPMEMGVSSSNGDGVVAHASAVTIRGGRFSHANGAGLHFEGGASNLEHVCATSNAYGAYGQNEAMVTIDDSSCITDNATENVVTAGIALPVIKTISNTPSP